ncbi:hypothetical protein JK354_18590 [Haloferax volcanii]|nr:hypothetical protein [Haloferax volcanii]MBS8121151.1 hypothetical protein [Haloferax volcanii]MBS8126162.1 hypothetical protein [Haloferax volcanii]MBS8130016.1 hypothetical protein [Haloferax volcanii]MBS8133880.1 hypothetical protein [Haloferax volcanii]MDW7539182.1 hypothetical protein [Haloferax volcanii]
MMAVDSQLETRLESATGMMKVEYTAPGMATVYSYQSDSEYPVDLLNWVCPCQDPCDDCRHLLRAAMELDPDEMSVLLTNDSNELNPGDEDGELQTDGGECDCPCCTSDIGFPCFDAY